MALYDDKLIDAKALTSALQETKEYVDDKIAIPDLAINDITAAGYVANREFYAGDKSLLFETEAANVEVAFNAETGDQEYSVPVVSFSTKEEAKEFYDKINRQDVIMYYTIITNGDQIIAEVPYTFKDTASFPTPLNYLLEPRKANPATVYSTGRYSKIKQITYTDTGEVVDINKTISVCLIGVIDQNNLMGEGNLETDAETGDNVYSEVTYFNSIRLDFINVISDHLTVDIDPETGEELPSGIDSIKIKCEVYAIDQYLDNKFINMSDLKNDIGTFGQKIQSSNVRSGSYVYNELAPGLVPSQIIDNEFALKHLTNTGEWADPYDPRFTNYLVTNKLQNRLQSVIESQEINGITIAVAEDGSFTVSGTATANTRILIGEVVTFGEQYYRVVGLPSNLNKSDYRIVPYSKLSDIYSQFENGVIYEDSTITGDGRLVDGSAENFTVKRIRKSRWPLHNSKYLYLEIGKDHVISITSTFKIMVIPIGIPIPSEYVPPFNVVSASSSGSASTVTLQSIFEGNGDQEVDLGVNNGEPKAVLYRKAEYTQEADPEDPESQEQDIYLEQKLEISPRTIAMSVDLPEGIDAHSTIHSGYDAGFSATQSPWLIDDTTTLTGYGEYMAGKLELAGHYIEGEKISQDEIEIVTANKFSMDLKPETPTIEMTDTVRTALLSALGLEVATEEEITNLCDSIFNLSSDDEETENSGD